MTDIQLSPPESPIYTWHKDGGGDVGYIVHGGRLPAQRVLYRLAPNRRSAIVFDRNLAEDSWKLRASKFQRPGCREMQKRERNSCQFRSN